MLVHGHRGPQAGERASEWAGDDQEGCLLVSRLVFQTVTLKPWHQWCFQLRRCSSSPMSQQLWCPIIADASATSISQHKLSFHVQPLYLPSFNLIPTSVTAPAIIPLNTASQSAVQPCWSCECAVFHRLCYTATTTQMTSDGVLARRPRCRLRCHFYR